jgi:uncharacterized protein YjbI with pentapeptide repeats
LHVFKRWAAWPQGIRWLAGIAAVVLVLAIVWVLFVPIADWIARLDVGSVRGPRYETAVDNARGRLLTLGAGLLAAGALLFTARNFVLSREGQVTDRYTKAIEQLGSEKLDVRIGGIYALERIARDSARDHPTVMEVLSAFIREHSREHWPPPAKDQPGTSSPMRTTRPDVQAALTVIGRRTIERDSQEVNLRWAILILAHLDGAHLDHADLSHAQLNGAYLNGAHLNRAHLDYALLDGAYLDDASLHDASLHDASLDGAHLERTHLNGAHLDRAHLRVAFLTDTHFTGAHLPGADLRHARLTGADLTGADLTGADLTDAKLTGARWPRDVVVPKGWKRDTVSGRLSAAPPGAETPEAN